MKTALLLLAAAVALAASPPMLVRGDSFEGVIFPKERRAFAHEFNHTSGFWTPGKSDVVRAEAVLRDYVNKHESLEDPRRGGAGSRRIREGLGAYKRQYSGVISEGRRILFINLFCPEAPAEWTRDWKEKELLVDDGGACYFRVKVDLKARRCFDVIVNGAG